jgi:hypothetical protein
MAVNISTLLTDIKIDLGIYGLVLPFENADQEMVNVIKSRTLGTFSRFFPDDVKISFDLKDLQALKDLYQESIYVIPDVFGDRKILSIRKIFPRSLLISSGYYAPYIDSSPEMYQAMMMTQANANLMSSLSPPFTFKFKEPNIVYLYNVSTMYGILDFEFNMEHSKNLSTIKDTMYETFFDLAILDVKKLLYGSMKHYKTLNTAYGTINLEIDDWANADSERKDMVEKWRDVYHLEQEQFYII